MTHSYIHTYVTLYNALVWGLLTLAPTWGMHLHNGVHEQGIISSVVFFDCFTLSSLRIHDECRSLSQAQTILSPFMFLFSFKSIIFIQNVSYDKIRTSTIQTTHTYIHTYKYMCNSIQLMWCSLFASIRFLVIYWSLVCLSNISLKVLFQVLRNLIF